MSNLPNDSIYEIALRLSPEKIIDFCSISKWASSICSANDFWRKKYDIDYTISNKIQIDVENMEWKELYVNKFNEIENIREIITKDKKEGGIRIDIDNIQESIKKYGNYVIVYTERPDEDRILKRFYVSTVYFDYIVILKLKSQNYGTKVQIYAHIPNYKYNIGGLLLLEPRSILYGDQIIANVEIHRYMTEDINFEYDIMERWLTVQEPNINYLDNYSLYGNQYLKSLIFMEVKEFMHL